MERLKSKFCRDIEMLGKQIGGYPDRLKITIYHDSKTLQIFRLEFSDNKAYTMAMIDISIYLKRTYGINVELVEICLDKYMQWLRGRPDSYHERLKYLAQF